MTRPGCSASRARYHFQRAILTGSDDSRPSRSGAVERRLPFREYWALEGPRRGRHSLPAGNGATPL